MLDWLAKNKEWLFSGVGLLVVVGLVKLLWGTFFPRNAGARDSDPSGVSTTSSETQVLSQGQSPEAAHAATEGQVTDLTLQDIFTHLDGLPELQKPDAARHYLGIHVQWEGELASLREVEDGVEVMLRQTAQFGPDSFIIFEVDPEEYPGLGLLRSGDAVLTVEGVISKVRSMGRWSELTEARIVDGL